MQRYQTCKANFNCRLDSYWHRLLPVDAVLQTIWIDDAPKWGEKVVLNPYGPAGWHKH